MILVDYGVGNLKSVQRAFEKQGATCTLSRDPDQIASANAIILPGQGAFAEAVAHLESAGLTEIINTHISAGKAFFGICLGFQILFETSEEKGQHQGLGIFKGAVNKFDPTISTPPLTVPHVGWNTLNIKNDALNLFNGQTNPYAYFTHSYYVDTPETDIICTQTDYGLGFTSSIQTGKLFACQFHPEKSGDLGAGLISSFLKSVSA